jgi:hypothetical protein
LTLKVINELPHECVENFSIATLRQFGDKPEQVLGLFDLQADPYFIERIGPMLRLVPMELADLRVKDALAKLMKNEEGEDGDAMQVEDEPMGMEIEGLPAVQQQVENAGAADAGPKGAQWLWDTLKIPGLEAPLYLILCPKTLCNHWLEDLWLFVGMKAISIKGKADVDALKEMRKKGPVAAILSMSLLTETSQGNLSTQTQEKIMKNEMI